MEGDSHARAAEIEAFEALALVIQSELGFCVLRRKLAFRVNSCGAIRSTE
jgi:hypothetical protein